MMNMRWHRLLFLFLSAASVPSFAVTPMEYHYNLVAGGDGAGYVDGDFVSARFDQPGGLAVSDDGTSLYVADRNNHRIRVVHLDRQNQVETFAGNGSPGRNDGIARQASFNDPQAVAFIKGGRLAVYDAGNSLIRLVDLKSGLVSTLGPAEEAWNLVYLPSEDALYYSQPERQRLLRLDLKSGQSVTVLSGDPRVPRPKALCLFQDKLIVADVELPDVYRLDSMASGEAGADPVPMTPVGKGTRILELAASAEKLYALQSGPVPIARVIPQQEPLNIITPWGFFIDNENSGVPPFLFFESHVPIGFTVSPVEPRKLYVSKPIRENHCIYSLKDYDYEGKEGAYEYAYPSPKPPKTFRILVLGDSRLIWGSTYVPGARAGTPGLDLEINQRDSPRVNTFPKQLEFLLNRESVLADLDIRFEVVVEPRAGTSLSDHLYWNAPQIVDQTDADLVLALAGWAGYHKYFIHPLQPEGIPSADPDGEYLLKSVAERIPPGIFTKFYDRCVQKGLIQKGEEIPFGDPSNLKSQPFFLGASADPQLREAMLEMDGRVFRLFVDKLRKTRKGRTKFLVFFLPWQILNSCNDAYASYWKDLCARNQVGFLDLSPGYYALKPAFHPTADSFANNHYNVYGNSMIAYMLSYYLPRLKWIPSSPLSKPARRSF